MCRYVEFKPFIKGMFTATSLRGRFLHRALRHQHRRIYNYDRSTVYGSFPSPSKDMSQQFLDLCHYDKGGRIFTYVITLDGLWRFTETGKEFGIDMLSKHTMHSDVNIYIAYSGEFFIRRLKHPHRSISSEDQETHPPGDIDGGPPSDDPPKDPSHYVLVIDNDSGTYRPSAALLPQLKHYLHENLPGIKIVTLDCQSDEEKMNKWKSEQRARKKAEGSGRVLIQGDDASSISSSEASDLDEQERKMTGGRKLSKKQKLEQKIHLKRKAEEKGDGDLHRIMTKELEAEGVDGAAVGEGNAAEEIQQVIDDEKANRGPAEGNSSAMEKRPEASNGEPIKGNFDRQSSEPKIDDIGKKAVSDDLEKGEKGKVRDLEGTSA